MDIKDLRKCDREADKIVAYMVASVAGASAIPIVVNWGVIMAAMGAGCVGVGMAYGFKLEKNQGGVLVRQFLIGAGVSFLAMHVGSALFALCLQGSGVGYFVGTAVEMAFAIPCAWAIGDCARLYFRKKAQGEALSPLDMKSCFRKSFSVHKLSIKKKHGVRNGI